MLEKRTTIVNFTKKVEKQYQAEKQLNEIIDNIRLITFNTSKIKNKTIIDKVDDIVQ
jgi:hypothetical protein